MAAIDPSLQRVGMFGGAFDPPHGAHRALAEAAIAQLQLDRLHVLPTGHAWHKARTLSPAHHRIAMCERAFGDLPKVRIDVRETERAGPTFTADTLVELRREYPQARLFLILGADQLLAFKSWQRWQEVLDVATLAVANRPTSIGAQALLGQADETDLSGVDVPFVRIDMPLQHLSATAVRARLAAAAADGPPLDVLVPPAVAGYISQHHLYQPLT
ncbi:MAG: nicotinate (nicotinamide) nucleotide adenylyltransferase [Hydrogenophaga sp.]|uniref:nicotinate (nicotinamide) nucleotide adenylyltransferase n=1 Tax=Hydrogenophaga sp. TaxID=1904254 RepID=UPI001DE96A76|nr:nicotinate (nicotinamide) nucleotide adenylyltransferase [Hydrogenophaga sp.]MBX3610212.1 nicotinate (nicotinamide) nucleotide adenylyltransferase [Hydrogenophaga sp.]